MSRIQTVLVANRGEIAVRIIRTCQSLGLKTVLAASKADLNSMAAQLADRVVCIGPAHATASYLRVDTIVQAALGTGAQAIHPGYGFLAERADLAQLCEDNGVIFIGPTAAQISAVGDKLSARDHAVVAGVPIVPGVGPLSDLGEALVAAKHLGYPVLLKAVGGGGGRGMKRVNNADELRMAFDLAAVEAGNAFGDARIYVERFVTRGRHVEVQVIGDGEDVIHIGDRDCSVQRRYQKLIEEAPAPNLPDEIRHALYEAAVSFGKHIRYRSLGTIEFLYDVDRLEFYFLEMNARIQVEHPVTEMISGLDLVAEQIHIAQGNPLRLRQADIQLSGHAIECRINAEDPCADFLPCPGRIQDVSFPQGSGLRVDTHIQAGTIIPPFYDSLVAKLVCHGTDREQALAKLRRAIADARVDGITTNLALHSWVLDDSDFSKGGIDTSFLPGLLEKRQ